MKLRVTTTLRCSHEQVWQELQTTRLLNYICYPLVVFAPVDPSILPIRWSERRYDVKIKLFGFLPFGTQAIVISVPEPYCVRDNGFSRLIPKWDHLISIRPDDNGTKYTDTVDIKAGLLTPIVWAYASIFYRYRQYRWRKIVASGFRYPRSSDATD